MSENQHSEEIVDQFTRQAAQFAESATARNEDLLRAILQMAAPQPQESVLDVACGTGKSFAPLLQRGYVVIACDASSGMMARARARTDGRAEVVTADVRHLPVLGAFDLVACLDARVDTDACGRS